MSINLCFFPVRMIVGEYEQRAVYKRYNVVGSGPDSALETPGTIHRVYPFRPEFTIVIYILYKPRIAVAILDL